MDKLIHEIAYRGDGLVEKLAKVPIVVCGCGAIGSNLIYNMVRQGFASVTVIDKDRIEEHNAGTQIWGLREVNAKKAQMMKNKAYADVGCQITAVDKELDASNVGKLLPKGSIVVDSFDNSKSRGIVTEHCTKQGIDCLHTGLFEGIGEACWNEKYQVPNDVVGQDVCEYPLSRNICMLTVLVAIESIIRYVSTGEKHSFTVSLGDLKVVEID